MAISKIQFYSSIVALSLTVCSFAYVYFSWSVDQSRRFLSSKCGECPEGEEAYFRAYPDVAMKWKPRKAYHHWKRYGKSEGRHYNCLDRVVQQNSSCGGRVKKCPEGEEAYFRTYPDVNIKWKPKSAYKHWRKDGYRQGRHYICNCKKSEDSVVSVKEKKGNGGGLVIVAVFKNEAMTFAEWISHYLWQGVSHFYLFDNGSTDDWMQTIPQEVHARITVIRDERKHAQRLMYKSLLPMLQTKHPKDWVLIVDFDEYIFAKPPHTIASYLSTVSDGIGEVRTKW